MPEHEAMELFAADTARDVTHRGQVAPGKVNSHREEFLTGLLATWAASERGSDVKPSTEEKRRARAGARAALGEILR